MDAEGDAPDGDGPGPGSDGPECDGPAGPDGDAPDGDGPGDGPGDDPPDDPEPPDPEPPDPDDAPEPDEPEPDPTPGNETKPSCDGGKDKSSLYEGRLIQVQGVRTIRPRPLTNWLPQVTRRLEAGPYPRAASTPRRFAQPGNSHNGSGRKEGMAKW